MAILAPAAGKTHRAYIWSYSIGAFEPTKAVIYAFFESRGGWHAQESLGDWRGTLIGDNYSSYKALLANCLTEGGCMAHARRKFLDLHSQTQSLIAGEALDYFGKLYGAEREVVELDADERLRVRVAEARPIADELHAWLTRQQQVVPNGSVTARAIDYSLKRWEP